MINTKCTLFSSHVEYISSLKEKLFVSTLHVRPCVQKHYFSGSKVRPKSFVCTRFLYTNNWTFIKVFGITDFLEYVVKNIKPQKIRQVWIEWGWS